MSDAAAMRIGRPFVHPVFDLGLIGGGFSLLLVGALLVSGWAPPIVALPYLIFVSNLAHFAASTVRLYTKPRAFEELANLTYVLPLATFAVVTGIIVLAAPLGPHFQALYLTWSPFHYAMQAFGLAAMYAMRSGVPLSDGSRRALWWVCVLPFVFAFCSSTSSGLGWLLPAPTAMTLAPMLTALRWGLGSLALVTPLLLMWQVGRRDGRTLPLISLLIVMTNAVWWIGFEPAHAFVWATIFHGVQYLAIVTIFHLRDHPPARGGALWGAVKFYAACVALGWLLFEVWPYAYVRAGFTLAQSMLLCTAAINVHHFIVDRGIWRLRRDPTNLIVVGQSA